MVFFLEKLVNHIKNTVDSFIYLNSKNEFIYLVNTEVAYVKSLVDFLEVLIASLDSKASKNMLDHIERSKLIDLLIDLVKVSFKYREAGNKDNDGKLPFVHCPSEISLAVFKFLTKYGIELAMAKKDMRFIEDTANGILKYFSSLSLQDTEFNNISDYLDMLRLFDTINEIVRDKKNQITFEEIEETRIKLIALYITNEQDKTKLMATKPLNDFYSNYSNHQKDVLWSIIKKNKIFKILFKTSFSLNLIKSLNSFFNFFSSYVDIDILNDVLEVQEYQNDDEARIYRRAVLPIIGGIGFEVC